MATVQASGGVGKGKKGKRGLKLYFTSNWSIRINRPGRNSHLEPHCRTAFHSICVIAFVVSTVRDRTYKMRTAEVRN